MQEDQSLGDWRENLPNRITATRILFSPLLVLLAAMDRPIALAILAGLLVFTEWLDGFIARRLGATSSLGARLDTVADVVFYVCLLAAVVLLQPETIGGESTWIGIAVASYAVSWFVSWIKFLSLPSYHTWAAKAVWGLLAIGILMLLTDVSPWPFRIAMVCVAVANLESTAISLTLSESEVDVPTLWHAFRRRSPQKSN